MSYTFVHETPNNQVKRLIALILMILLVVSCTIVAVVNYGRAQGKESSESFLSRYTPDIVHDITPLKQLILGIISGIVFIPIPAPIEFTFYVGLKQGNSVLLSMGAAILGIVIGIAISYLTGWKLSKQVVYLLSTKHIYAVRRKVNKYGVHAILLMFLVPSPGDMLSFSLGIAKYNMKRFFFFLIIAVTIKLVAIAAFVHYFP